jgi:two-component system, sensor histidine kinase and response regulator
MWVAPLVLVLSTLLQLAAAVIALRLMRITGRNWAWGLVAAGIALMAARRSFLLWHVVQTGNYDRLEILGLVISACLFTGLAGIAPLFHAFRQSQEELHNTQSDLEQRVRDRTAELAAANEGLQQERYLLHTLMNYLPHNIYFKDAHSRFIRINSAMARYFGLQDPGDAIGKTDVDYFTDEHALQALADEQEIVRSGKGIIDKEEKETWPDGRATWASSTKLPLYDDAGQVVGTFGISQDITSQKRVAEALRSAKEAAEAGSRAKSSFLANVSHEIRTPLNAVIGMTELVLKTQLTTQQREFLSTVRDSGEALLSVINDILDFSKIEAEKLVLENERFHLRESLGDTMKSFAIRAHQQGLELGCHIHTDVPAWVVGDYPRLRQVVVNLVNNAIKFTTWGEVVLEVARLIPTEQAASEGNGAVAQGESEELPVGSDKPVELHFSVSDTGIGIPAEKHSSIFGMFEQADSSTTRRHGGTGLGLAIASRLVQLMGGRMWVESEVGRGSRFHFTVGLQEAEADAADAADKEPVCLHGMRVLVVDDNATNRRILEEVLSSWQMMPTSVENAAQAIEHMRRIGHSGEPLPLVITDAHMPDVDGFTLARRIREDRQIGGSVIMMLTSGDRPNDTGECERLGIGAYLLKPIKQSELLESIQLVLGIVRPRRVQRGRAGQRQTPGRCLQILLAEDSLVNQQLAVALLDGEGHKVTVAGNGREAVAAVESGNFDCVLMDLQMPEMDGLEATAIIRAHERTTGRHVPIIAMTAHALKGDRERCLEAGMDGYTSKPIDADDLFAAIAELVGGQVQTAVEDSSLEKCSEGFLPPSDSMIDWSAALKAVRGDSRLLETIVGAALGEVPYLLTELRRAVAARDFQGLRLAAHTLKGSVRYFGAQRVLELALRLEAIGQNHQIQDADATLASLDQSAGELMAALARWQPSGNGGTQVEGHEVTP